MTIVAVEYGYAALANMYAVPFTSEAQQGMEDCLDTVLFPTLKIWRRTP